jgi:hypothetical protein
MKTQRLGQLERPWTADKRTIISRWLQIKRSVHDNLSQHRKRVRHKLNCGSLCTSNYCQFTDNHHHHSDHLDPPVDSSQPASNPSFAPRSPSNRSTSPVFHSSLPVFLLICLLLLGAIPSTYTAPRCLTNCSCVYFKNKLQADCSLQHLPSLPQVRPSLSFLSLSLFLSLSRSPSFTINCSSFIKVSSERIVLVCIFLLLIDQNSHHYSSFPFFYSHAFIFG